MVTGADAVADLLERAGVTVAYGVPGQRVLPLFAALQSRGIEVVVTRHEQGAAFMADVHGRIGGLGCVITTSGPGGINALAGAAAAWMDSVPLVAITAQAEVAEFGRSGIQDGSGLGRTPDVVQMFGATTKATFQPHSVPALVADVAQALALAVEGRPGPVHIDVPSDLFTTDVESEEGASERAAECRRPSAVASEPDPQVVAEVARRIRGATLPLLLVGNGAVRAGAVDAAAEVARRGGMVVAHSFLAKGSFDETELHVLGPVGIFGTEVANRALHEEADLVVAVGVAFSYLTTSGWAARLGADRLVRCDLDPRELGTNYADGLNVHADASVFLEALAQHLGNDGEVQIKAAQDAGRQLKLAHPDEGADADTSPLHPITVCEVVGERIGDVGALVADVGQNAYWVERHLKIRGGSRFVINGGLGAMGHGVAGCLGAWHALRSLGQPGRVLCTTGDGGFMMGALEVSTAVDQRADITWVIFDNGTLGTQKEWYVRQGTDGSVMDLPPTDYAALARAMGATAFRVATATALRDALDVAATTSGPVVIDVLIDPVPAPKAFEA